MSKIMFLLLLLCVFAVNDIAMSVFKTETVPMRIGGR